MIMEISLIYLTAWNEWETVPAESISKTLQGITYCSSGNEDDFWSMLFDLIYYRSVQQHIAALKY